MMQLIAEMAGSMSILIGRAYHLFDCAVIGAIFGAILGSKTLSYKDGFKYGPLFGLAWWILGGLDPQAVFYGYVCVCAQSIQPVLPLAFASLVGHVLFGLIVGGVFVAIRKRRKKPKFENSVLKSPPNVFVGPVTTHENPDSDLHGHWGGVVAEWAQAARLLSHRGWRGSILIGNPHFIRKRRHRRRRPTRRTQKKCFDSRPVQRQGQRRLDSKTSSAASTSSAAPPTGVRFRALRLKLYYSAAAAIRGGAVLASSFSFLFCSSQDRQASAQHLKHTPASNTKDINTTKIKYPQSII